LTIAIMGLVIITDIIHVTATMAGAINPIITASIADMTVVIAGTAAMIHIVDIIVRATYGNM